MAKQTRPRHKRPTENISSTPSRVAGDAAWSLPTETWQCLLIMAVTLCVYLPSLELGWIWDDDQYIYSNPNLRSWDGLKQIWCDTSATPQYYPAVFTLLWCEFHIFGDQPAVYHGVNVFLHSVNACLCLLILRQLRLSASLWIALAFAIHPIQVETVAWATEIKNILSTCFYALAWLCWWRPLVYMREAGAKDLRKNRTGLFWVRLSLGLVCFLLALLSKSVTASLPAALLLCLWFRFGSISKLQGLCLLPLLLLGGAFGWNTARLERLHVGALGNGWDYGWIDRIGIASRCIWHYCQQALLPWEPTFFYPRIATNFGPEAALATVGCLIALLACVLFAFRGFRGPFTAAAFFVGSAFPALGFLNVYPHRFSFVADHFVYLPIIGLLCLIWTGMFRVATTLQTHLSVPKALSAIPMVSLLCMYTFGVTSYLPAFANEICLWSDTLAKNPTSVAAMQNLGLAYAKADRPQHALTVLSQAAKHDFDKYQTLNSLGMVWGMLGQPEKAIESFQASLNLKPDNPQPWINLGNLRYSQARTLSSSDMTARECYENAWRIEPNYLAAFALGTLDSQQQNWEGAAHWFERAVAERPWDLDARYNLAWSLAQQGRHSDSKRLCNELLLDFPNDRDTQRLLRATR